MKKIYTLLAAACVSVSAMAVAPGLYQLKNVSVTPEKLEALANTKVDASMLKDNGVDRVVKITDAQGKEWSQLISIMGEIKDALGPDMPFSDFPFYIARVNTQAMYEGSNTVVSLFLSWPCNASMDMDLYSERADGQGLEFDIEAAKAKYGETALDPMSYDDVVKAMEGTKFYCLPGMYYQPAIIGCQAFGGSFGSVLYANNKYNGNPAFPVAATATNDGLNLANATSWDWLSFDPATSDVKVDLQYKYSSTNEGAMNGNVTGAFGVQLEGYAIVLGLSDILWDTIGQVHIFNGGRQDKNSDWSMNLDYAFDGALNMYYIAMCDNTFAYTATNTQTGEEVNAYTDTELPAFQSQSGTITGGTTIVVADDYHMNWLAGAIWAPENLDKPYGVWTMKTPKTEQLPEGGTIYRQTAEPMNLFVYANSACGEEFGFYIMYEGYLNPGVPGKSFIGIGDKKYGVNFRIGSAMTAKNSWIGSSQEQIFYHATPGKWTEFTPLDAVTDGTYNVIDNATSVEGVESDAPVVSATYYNFQGQRLSSEPESGLYIIRAVKADGTVKATKVAK